MLLHTDSNHGVSELTLSEVTGITFPDSETDSEALQWDSQISIQEEVLAKLQDEHAQFVASTECFMGHFREQIQSHQRQVREHFEKQVELTQKMGAALSESQALTKRASFSTNISSEIKDVTASSSDVEKIPSKSTKSSGRKAIVEMGSFYSVQTIDSSNSKSQGLRLVRTTKADVHSAYERAKMLAKGGVRIKTEGGLCAIMDMLSDWVEFVRDWLLVKRLQCTRIAHFVEGPQFRVFILSVIFANTIFIAVEASKAISRSIEAYDSRKSGQELNIDPEAWVTVVDTIFFVIYLIEMVLRLVVHEGDFFLGIDWQWNCFDLLVVLLAVIEKLLVAATAPTIFRLVRLLRLTRSVRTVRLLRVFPSLYPLQLMMLSCRKSLAALCWASLFLGVVLFLFAVVFISVATDYINEATPESVQVDTLRSHFESVPVAMLTLFLSFLGEADYKDIITLLFEVDAVYCVLFLLFVLFATLALANIIAGIFIAEAMETAGQDREIRQRGELVRARKNMAMLSEVFIELDTTGTGQLHKDDFHERLQIPEVQSLLAYFNFNALDAEAFFSLLDADNSGFVDIEEFVVGCLRMHGKANAIELELSIHETKALAKKIVDDMKKFRSNEVKMHQKLSEILFHVKSVIEQVEMGRGDSQSEFSLRRCDDNR